MPGLKIEVGKKYKDSRGHIIEILDKWNDDRVLFPFIGNYDCDFNEGGRTMDSDWRCDLIEEVKE